MYMVYTDEYNIILQFGRSFFWDTRYVFNSATLQEIHLLVSLLREEIFFEIVGLKQLVATSLLYIAFIVAVKSIGKGWSIYCHIYEFNRSISFLKWGSEIAVSFALGEWRT